MDAVPDLPGGAWLESVRMLAPTSPDRPPRPELIRLLRRLGATDEDVAELPDLIDEVLADRRLSWLATRFTTALRRDIGVRGLRPAYVEPARAWPTLPLSDGPAGRCVYLPGFLGAVGELHRLHRSRGIPEERAWATTADLGRQLAAHRRTFGVAGVDTQWWLMMIWDGGIVDLGRLQGEWRDQRRVGLHIPETGPLAAAAVDASLDLLRTDWPAWFGTRPEIATCASWLLDPHLADVLPATSNIVDFQRRFVIDDRVQIDDDEALYFVFRRRGVTLDQLADLPRGTSLQRAILDHLGAGGHWTIRRGVLRL